MDVSLPLKNTRRRSLLIWLFGSVLSTASPASAGQGIHDLRSSLSGAPDSPDLVEFLRSSGVEELESITWRDDIEEPVVETWMRFRDVDRDGDPEIFLALHDLANVHWFILRPSGPNLWGDPLYLASTAFATGESEWIEQRINSSCPRSYVVSGRVLIYYNEQDSWDGARVPDRHVVWQFVDGGLREVFSHETGGERNESGEWWALSTGVAGEVHFFRWGQTFKDGERVLYRRILPADEFATRPAEEVRFEVVERIRTFNDSRVNPPDVEDRMHPAVVAFDFGRLPDQVLESDLLDRLGVDRAQVQRLLGGYGGDYPVEAAVSYEDIDADGSLEAWVVLRHLGTYAWVLMDRDEAGEWICVGLRGELWIEHGGRYFENNPPTPAAHHLGGRTLLVYDSGSTHDLGAEIHSEVCLYEAGRLTPLWSEVVFGHDFDTQDLSFAERDAGSIRLEVVTYDGWHTDDDKVKQRRSWILAPGETVLSQTDG